MIKYNDGDIPKTVDLGEYDYETLDDIFSIKTILGTKYYFTGSKTYVSVYTYTNNVYRCVADIPLEKCYVGGLVCYHPSYTRIDSNYQGKGLAKHFYIHISKKLNIRIRAGKTQSPGSVKLWYKLCKDRNVFMAMYRKGKGWYEACLDDRNKEITGDGFSPYDTKTMAAVFQAY